MSANDNRISSHILPTSATMLGVCVTAISLVRLMHAGTVGVYIDKLLAMDSVLFVICSVLSFAAVRRGDRGAKQESLAESIFLGALILLGLASILMALEIK
ncbi:MAG: hypothetical protein P4L87_20785 [Formivibrio sp.]|nr:hypothetical protein [Formivibrio sp.]